MQIHSIPYLLRLNDEGLTGQALYQFLFQRIRRAVDNQVDGDGEDLESLVLPSNPPRDAKMEQNHFAGEVPHYGFRLRYVSNDGLRCVQSHWLNRSIGRFIPADDTPLNLVDGATVAIDWHFSVIKVWPRLGRQPAVQIVCACCSPNVPAATLHASELLRSRSDGARAAPERKSVGNSERPTAHFRKMHRYVHSGGEYSRGSWLHLI